MYLYLKGGGKMTGEPMTDKQYEGMLKDSIAMLDRIARQSGSAEDFLRTLLLERELLESKLGYEVEDNNLYDSVKHK